jgi:hypothetical protein
MSLTIGPGVLSSATAKAEIIVLHVANRPTAHTARQGFQLDTRWLVGLIEPGSLCSGI